MSLPLLGAGMATDGPSAVLDLNFASLLSLTPSVGPTPSYTRASTGTYFDASGVLTTAAINGPRFDHVYNGVSWVSKGLLIEEARTNSVLQSNALATSGIWTNAANRNTMAQSGEISPDSAANAWTGTCVVTTASGCRLEQGVAGAAGTYTLTQFVKKGNNGFCGMAIYATGGPTDIAYYLFDLTLGIFGSPTITGYTNVSVSAKSVGSGWWRISLTITKGNAATMVIAGAITANSLTDGGCTTGQTNLFYGYQLEAGAFPTSYIPTTAAAVTRSADVCQITGGDFSGFWNASEGSFVTEADSIGFSTTGPDRYIISFTSSGTANISHAIFLPTPGLSFDVYNSTLQARSSYTQPNAGDSFKLASCYKANDFAATLNGSAVQTDTSGTVPTINNVGIGHYPSFNQYANCHIARLRYFNTRLINSQLVALSS